MSRIQSGWHGLLGTVVVGSVFLASQAGGWESQGEQTGPAASSRMRPTSADNRPAPAATSESQAALAARIASLVRQLAAGEFTQRETAQQDLVDLGGRAALLLVPHLDHPDVEVSQRVFAALQLPDHPKLRLEVAARLIDSGKEDRVLLGIEFLFENPTESLAAIEHEAPAGSQFAYFNAALPPLREALRRFVEFTAMSDTLRRAAATRPAADEKIAAYQRALDEQREGLIFVAMVESIEAMRARPAQPAPPASSTSQPASTPSK